jgi:hypothetical protein
MFISLSFIIRVIPLNDAQLSILSGILFVDFVLRFVSSVFFFSFLVVVGVLAHFMV